jgi:hypothetical protein
MSLVMDSSNWTGTQYPVFAGSEEEMESPYFDTSFSPADCYSTPGWLLENAAFSPDYASVVEPASATLYPGSPRDLDKDLAALYPYGSADGEQLRGVRFATLPTPQSPDGRAFTFAPDVSDCSSPDAARSPGGYSCDRRSSSSASSDNRKHQASSSSKARKSSSSSLHHHSHRHHAGRDAATVASSSTNGTGNSAAIQLRSSRRKRSPTAKVPVSPADKEGKARFSHNQVEKQYRERLNKQFERLLAVLPRPDGEDDDEFGGGGGGGGYGDDSARKMSKAEALDLATRTIRDLERQRSSLEQQKTELTVSLGRMRVALASGHQIGHDVSL